jgi:glycosyltransferase involved in cell wall biosynthesis
MTRIAFYLNTGDVDQADLRDVDAGNPGTGGTEYQFLLIAKYLSRSMAVHFYATRVGAFPEGVTYHPVRDFADADRQFQANGEKRVILRESEVLANVAVLRASPLEFLVWAHNYSNAKTLKACCNLANVVRYLCVSREQYEQLRDERIFGKCAQVNAAAVADAHAYLGDPGRSGGNAVFYMGSIVPQKGFHVLARQWQEIRRAVPDATLHVVGSGQLYDRSVRMGPLGIASAAYESLFARHITRDGELREDVIFHGIVSAADKNPLLRTARVAVVNPTGVGETFCSAALEFELLGVPVITRNFGGPRNVVVNGVTGILLDREGDLAQAVVRLLRDDQLRASMAERAVAHARGHFDIQVVIRAWERLLEDLERGVPPVPDFTVTHPCRLKRVKDCNRRLRAAPGLGWLPSVDAALHLLRKKQASLFTKPLRRLQDRFS